MSPTTPRRPLVPEDINRGRPRDTLFKALTASFVGKVLKRHPLDVIGDDRSVELLLRSPTSPATLSGSGWADKLAASAVADVLTALVPVSAAADLIQRGLRVNFEGHASIIVPGRVVTATDAGGFITEGAPIPVRALPVTSLTLTPFKLGVICVFSNELGRYSVPNAQRVIEQNEAAVVRLDAELFGNAAASSTRPAGLLNGLSTVGAATAGSEAMGQDIGKLLGALATAGGGRNPVFVCSPPQAGSLKLRAGAQWDYPVLSSPALAAGTVVCVEAGSFASGFSAVPEIDTTNAGALHFEDTTPLQLVSGAGPTVATPVRSLFQTDASAIKMVLRCSWGMRAAGHIQIVTSVTW